MLRKDALFPCAQRNEQKIRVCIRGIFGLLGSRLALAIRKNPDMQLVVGIAKNDPTLKEALASLQPLPEHIVQHALAEKTYLDERHSVVRDTNASQHFVAFEPADQLNLSKACDVVLDAASPGSVGKWMERYRAFQRPVILQSGEYPTGTSIVPPLIGGNNGNIYRQGDCVLSGVVPVLSYLEPIVARAQMYILTQYTEKLNDYTTDERLGTTYLRDDVETQLNNELQPLLPTMELLLVGVSQVSGLSYYTATMLLESRWPLTGQELSEFLCSKPRIRVVPGIRSTYEIAHFHHARMHAFGKSIAPITIFGNDLTSRAKSTQFKIRLAIDYRYIAVLPNIDAVRMLVRAMGGEEAMQITDAHIGFI
jgi:glyceraldehyde-3-phosphate dehydrogenase/erythrose-4-phosphate dehydrogenase